MNRRRRNRALGVGVGGVAFCLAAVLLLQPRRGVPTLSIEVLGYVQRTGPFARIAVTNTSEAAVTLGGTCLVGYAARDGPRLRTSIEGSATSVLRLGPGEGYIQEVFVFPAESGTSVWQFEVAAAYSSAYLELGRAGEDFVRRMVPSVRHPVTGRLFHAFTTDWQSTPP